MTIQGAFVTALACAGIQGGPNAQYLTSLAIPAPDQINVAQNIQQLNNLAVFPPAPVPALGVNQGFNPVVADLPDAQVDQSKLDAYKNSLAFCLRYLRLIREYWYDHEPEFSSMRYDISDSRWHIHEPIVNFITGIQLDRALVGENEDTLLTILDPYWDLAEEAVEWNEED